jgi:hypothetical protein
MYTAITQSSAPTSSQPTVNVLIVVVTSLQSTPMQTPVTPSPVQVPAPLNPEPEIKPKKRTPWLQIAYWIANIIGAGFAVYTAIFK